MRKLFLLTLALLSLSFGSAWAQTTFEQGNLRYTNLGGHTVSVKAAVTSITGAVVIPSTVTYNNVTYTVTETAAGAFNGCNGITSMTVPASIETVKRGFLTGCSSLKSLTIEDSDKPLYFQNDYNTFYNGDYEISRAELDKFYMGRDITFADGNRNVIISAKEIELSGKMTFIPNHFSDNNKALTKVTIGGNITKIGQEAFDQNTSLTSVTIISPVDTLLQSAFWGCKALETFKIPETVKYIAPAVFCNCTSLAELTIPSATEHINRGLLTGCTGLKKLTVQKSDKPLYYQNDYNTYYNGNDELFCAGELEEYYQGRDIDVAIGDKKIVTSAKKIELGGSMTGIPNYFTQSNAALATLIIGDKITKIGDCAFDGNTSLNSVTITAPVDTMLYCAFWGCTALKTFKIPETVKYIGPAVFCKCTSLAELTIPSGTEHINRGILTNCTALKSLTIEKSDKPLYFQNDYNTYYNGNDELFCAGELEEYYQGRDIDVAIGDKKIVTSAKKIELGGSMTGIPNYFTQSDTALATLIIGDKITKIGRNAFDSNPRLNSVTFNAPVDSIFQSVFWGCTALENIDLPSTLKYMGPAVFMNCSALSSLTIPAATEYIMRGLLTGCTGLKSLIIEDSSKPLFFQNDYNTYYNGTNELCKSDLEYFYMGRDVERTEPENILVTSAQKIKVAGTVTGIPGYFTKNNKALTEVLVQGDMTKIGYQAFIGCENLTSASIDAPIDTIRYEAFYSCTSLPGITLPKEMKCIERAAFYNCKSLASFTIPAATEHVERGIFTNCPALKSLIIEDSEKPLYFQNNYNTYYNGTNELCKSDLDYFYMGRDVNRTEPENILVTSAQKIKVAGTVTAVPGYFTKNNKALTEVLVQGNMTKISYQAFIGCENLTSATLDAPIDTIRYEAFYGCKALPGIEMPESMKCIEKAAFYNCSALSSFTIPAATEYVGRGIFTNCTALKSITIEDSDKPLYFQNDYNTYYNGNVELCTSDMESLYLGRDITRADASRLVSKVQKITLGTPVTDIGNMFSSTTNVTKVSVPWQTPIDIANAAFAAATYDNAILSVPGGTEATYRSRVGWMKFKSIQPGSYFVTATATAGGKLKFANLTVSDGTKKMLIDRETDVTFEVMPDENYDFTSLTVNGEAVPVTNGTYTYANLLSDINVEAKFTEKPKFDITATAIGGTVSLNGATPSASQSIKVYRDTGVVLTIAASEGYRLKTLTVNGADMTAQVSNNTLQLENIQEAQDIVVTFEQYIFSVSISGAGISVSTMTPQYGENVIVTIEDDPDRTLVALLVNGQDVTAQVANGQYVIKNVTGNVTIEATFRSTKEFITLTGELATYSCAQDLNFTGSDLKAYIAAGYNKQENEVLLVRVYDVPAGTGIVVKGTKNTTYKVPYFTSQSYYVNLLRAQLTPGQITATTGNMSNFVLKEDDSDGKFYAPESPVLLAGNKAFLQVPTDFFAGARFVKIVFAEEEGTGIDRFEMIEKTSGDAIYNLSGQRVQQTGRGIYIENGRKVLKK